LIEAGYPEESIVVNYKMPKTAASDEFIHIDIAIIDRTTNDLLSIFEFTREHSDDIKLEHKKNQLKKLMENLGIPAYFIIVKNEEDIEIYPIETEETETEEVETEEVETEEAETEEAETEEAETEEIETGKSEKRGYKPKPSVLTDSLTPYTILSNKSRTSAIKTTIEKMNDSTNRLNIVCAIGFLLAVLMFILDFSENISISTAQLTSIGAAIALLIIPYAKKLSILGIEFERLSDNKEKNEKKKD